MNFETIIAIVPWIILVVTFLFLVPAVLHWLWNITIPDIFSLKKISYWQAFRLFIISFLLIGIWCIGNN